MAQQYYILFSVEMASPLVPSGSMIYTKHVVAFKIIDHTAIFTNRIFDNLMSQPVFIGEWLGRMKFAILLQYRFMNRVLYSIVDKYRQSNFKQFSNFVAELEKDLEAVENAVSSPLSNGFVEGTNRKLKMVKRTMYGRCGRLLLEAKMMLVV